MIDRKKLLTDLQGLLGTIEADLLERSDSPEVPDAGAKLREEYAAAQKAERTAQNFEDWRSDSITQVAAAWVLSCVFVRFLEDNELVETPKIAGPGERLRRARDEHELYFRSYPTLTDRDYLLAVFDDLTKYAATKDVFGEHNPIRDLSNWLSGDAAGELIEFFQKVDPNTGGLVHDFADPAWDTRFLGDLYQDLSEAARKKYALLQTPVFVEEFILDRTLDPAIEEFGLTNPGYEERLQADGRLNPADCFRMIDPACGSGHFLLGGFSRLVEHWRRKEPGTRAAVLVQRALDSICGVDLNPFAVAVARFRMLLAALKEYGVTRLKDAPGFVINITCGDSLLHGAPGGDQYTMGWTALDHVYQPEDRETLARLLRPKSYHAVVANPPYITPKDASLNAAYRQKYSSCHREYSLAVPFMERIFSLAVDGGYTGQITANSFMKRDFGKKLVEKFFPTIDLTHVIDTSGGGGAHIPGHKTGTVILFGRQRRPLKSTVRAVMGIRGEPSTPEDPAKGLVWCAILDQLDQPGSTSDFVSVSDAHRAGFHRHPWSIGGGGASELKAEIEKNSVCHLEALVEAIGFVCMTRADDVYFTPIEALRRFGVPPANVITNVEGDKVRDWSITDPDTCLFPYDGNLKPLPDESKSTAIRFLWPHRTGLWLRREPNGNHRELGMTWHEWSRFQRGRFRQPLSLAFAFVATHNHFVFDRGGKVFKQSAPVIKLPAESSERDYLTLLGLLNSSTACFWMKQVFYPKAASSGDISTEKGKPEANRYEFAATGMNKFPIGIKLGTDSSKTVLFIAAEMHRLSNELHESLPRAVLLEWIQNPTGSKLGSSLEDGRRRHLSVSERMIALQEELDWEVYRLYGLSDEGASSVILDHASFGIPAIARPYLWNEERAPANVPTTGRATYEMRRQLLLTKRNLGIVENPVFKRPWWGRQGVYGRLSRDYDGWKSEALGNWLVDRMEIYFDFDGRMNDLGKPTARLPVSLVSIGRLADTARQDPHFHEVGALYRNDEAFDINRLVAELVESESVPLLPILRYKPTGIRKRAEWERTWDLQRQEDAIDARIKLAKGHPQYLTELDAADLKRKQLGTIPVPPKFTNADFLNGDYWRLRGKLDVPKERWVSFPYCDGEDGTMMVAWAGYDHLQLAQAISAYYVDVQERLGGRDDPRLVPLLACIIELLPWLKQWHNDVHPEFGVPMGDYFEGFLQEESRNLGLTLDEIRTWTPPQKARGGSKKKTTGKASRPVAEDDSLRLE